MRSRILCQFGYFDYNFAIFPCGISYFLFLKAFRPSIYFPFCFTEPTRPIFKPFGCHFISFYQIGTSHFHSRVSVSILFSFTKSLVAFSSTLVAIIITTYLQAIVKRSLGIWTITFFTIFVVITICLHGIFNPLSDFGAIAISMISFHIVYQSKHSLLTVWLMAVIHSLKPNIHECIKQMGHLRAVNLKQIQMGHLGQFLNK